MPDDPAEFYVDRIGVFMLDAGNVRIALMQTRPVPEADGSPPSETPVVMVGRFALSMQAAGELSRGLNDTIARFAAGKL